MKLKPIVILMSLFILTGFVSDPAKYYGLYEVQNRINSKFFDNYEVEIFQKTKSLINYEVLLIVNVLLIMNYTFSKVLLLSNIYIFLIFLLIFTETIRKRFVRRRQRQPADYLILLISVELMRCVKVAHLGIVFQFSLCFQKKYG